MVDLDRNTRRNRRVFLTTIYLSTLFFSLLFFRITFSSNDDNEIRAILDGSRFGVNDFHIPWINSTFTFPISKLYGLFPSIYWYEAILLTLSIVSYSATFYLFSIVSIKWKSTNFFASTVLISALMFKSLNSLSFSNTSITLTATSILFLFMFSQHQVFIKVNSFVKSLIIFLFFSLGYIIRPEISLGIVVFLLPVIIFSLLNREYRVTNFIVVLMLLIFVKATNIIDREAYSKSGWDKWKKFTDAYAWPRDSNLLSSSLGSMDKSEKLNLLGLDDTEYQLWLSANHIDPNQFPNHFLKSLQNIPLKFEFDQITIILNSFLVNYGVFIFLLILINYNTVQSSNFEIKKLNLKLFFHRINPSSFFLFYGIIYIITLILIRKDVPRITEGLVIYLMAATVLLSGLKIRNLPQSESSVKKQGRIDFMILALVLVLCVVTLTNHPTRREFFGGGTTAIYDEQEFRVLSYITRQPQCKVYKPYETSCVLFMHTNKTPPFEGILSSDVRVLYLFWSSFSPRWLAAIDDTGSADSLDLLCSNKGFLMSADSSVTLVKNYIYHKRGVQIGSIPVGSLDVIPDLKQSNLELTTGSSPGSC
jgi:hypothetical protein